MSSPHLICQNSTQDVAPFKIKDVKESFAALSVSNGNFAAQVSFILKFLKLMDPLEKDTRDLISTACLELISKKTSTIGSKIFCISILLEFLPNYAENIDFYEVSKKIPLPEAKSEYLWNVLFYAFSKEIRIERDLVRIYSDLSSVLLDHKSDPGVFKKGAENSKVVLVSTSQLIATNHSPTAMCLDICFAVHCLGYKPVLLVLRSAPEESTLPFISPYITNQNIRDFGFYTHHGIDIPMIPLKLGFNLTSVTQLTTLLRGLSPVGNIQVGGFFAHGELVARLVPSFLWTTSEFFTPSIHHKFVQVQRSLNDFDDHCLRAFTTSRHRYQQYFSKLTLCNTGFYSDLSPRAKIGFSEADIVIAVVGNRLDYELNQEELDFFYKLSDLDKRIKFAFFGMMSSSTQDQVTIACRSRMCFFGYVMDLQAQLASVDLFVNLRRIGGAGGLASALYAGVLGVSIDYGDVGCCLPNELKAENYSDLIAIILNIIKIDRKERFSLAQNILRADETYTEKVNKIIRLLQGGQSK